MSIRLANPESKHLVRWRMHMEGGKEPPALARELSKRFDNNPVFHEQLRFRSGSAYFWSRRDLFEKARDAYKKDGPACGHGEPVEDPTTRDQNGAFLPEYYHYRRRFLLDYYIEYLRRCTFLRLCGHLEPDQKVSLDKVFPPHQELTNCIPLWTVEPKARPTTPAILYEAVEALKGPYRGADVTWWYYRNLVHRYRLMPGEHLQRQIRVFVSHLQQATEKKRIDDRVPARLPVELDLNDFLSVLKSSDIPPATRWALMETCHTMNLLRWRIPDQEDGGVSGDWTSTDWIPPSAHPRNKQDVEGDLPKNLKGARIRFIHPPDASSLVAKLFGMKTDIKGFDDLLGGGLVVDYRREPARGTADWDDPMDRNRSCLGVIRGRFASGKSTLAAHLAFEMARKGGVGILLVLEQSVHDVVAHFHHFGWAPEDNTFCLVWSGADSCRNRDEREVFQEAVQMNNPYRGRGVLWVRSLGDSSLDRFQYWLEASQEFSPSPVEATLKAPRFIIVDPLDAVQLTGEEEAGHLLRNRVQQVLEEVAGSGISLWMTTGEVEPDAGGHSFGFLPNLGDVVIRLTTLQAGEKPVSDHINHPPHRLFELEKVRTQRFARGVHPFEITTTDGLIINPSGDAVNRFYPWFGDWDHDPTISEPISLGLPTLDLAIGGKGLRPGAVTTVMGPTGCGKTELALMYVLWDWGQKGKKGYRDGRCLFIAFRDDWDSLDGIIGREKPVGKQLGVGTTPWPLHDHLDVLDLKVHFHTSAWVLRKIRDKFKGHRYNRVVVDNVAYMELTSPLIKRDHRFIPNLVELIRRERATPVFITSRVEGMEQDSMLQAQIRDASDNVLVLEQSSRGGHEFIALQVNKSEGLLHPKQPLEVVIHDPPTKTDFTTWDGHPKTSPGKAPFRQKAGVFLDITDWLWGECEKVRDFTDAGVIAQKSYIVQSVLGVTAQHGSQSVPLGRILGVLAQHGLSPPSARFFDANQYDALEWQLERLFDSSVNISDLGQLPRARFPTRAQRWRANRRILADLLHGCQLRSYRLVNIAPLESPRYLADLDLVRNRITIPSAEAWRRSTTQAGRGALSNAMKGAERIGDYEYLLRDLFLQLWRLYWYLVDALELETGVCVRTHSLDPYPQVMHRSR